MVFDTENMLTEASRSTRMRNTDARLVVPALKSEVGDRLPAEALIVTHDCLIFRI